MKQTTVREKTFGILCGVLSAVFVALYVTTNKYVYGQYDIAAIEYGLIFSIVGAVFGIISLLSQINPKNAKLLRNNSGSLIILGAAGALAVGTFTVGLQHTTAVNASLLMTSTIVATALFSHFMLNERYSKQQFVWMLILFIGLYIGVVGMRRFDLQQGDLIILGSALFFGFGNVFSRIVMKRMGGPSLVPDARLTIGGILALPLFLFVVRDYSMVLDVLPLALVAGLFYWLCMKAFARAVYLINANKTIVLNNSQIFFTSLAGVLVLSESYSLEKLIGSLLAITAIYFIAGRK